MSKVNGPRSASVMWPIFSFVSTWLSFPQWTSGQFWSTRKSHPLNYQSPWTMVVGKFLSFWRPIFRSYVSFREGKTRLNERCWWPHDFINSFNCSFLFGVISSGRWGPIGSRGFSPLDFETFTTFATESESFGILGGWIPFPQHHVRENSKNWRFGCD